MGKLKDQIRYFKNSLTKKGPQPLMGGQNRSSSSSRSGPQSLLSMAPMEDPRKAEWKDKYGPNSLLSMDIPDPRKPLMTAPSSFPSLMGMNQFEAGNAGAMSSTWSGRSYSSSSVAMDNSAYNLMPPPDQAGAIAPPDDRDSFMVQSAFQDQGLFRMQSSYSDQDQDSLGMQSSSFDQSSQVSGGMKKRPIKQFNAWMKKNPPKGEWDGVWVMTTK